jgi:hypothetical protein
MTRDVLFNGEVLKVVCISVKEASVPHILGLPVALPACYARPHQVVLHSDARVRGDSPVHT